MGKCGQEPVAVPASQKDFDVSWENEVLDVACDALPLDEAAVECVVEAVRASRVHPVKEELDGGWVWDWEEDDGVRG